MENDKRGSIRVPLIGTLGNRNDSANKDTVLKNCYGEAESQDIKRVISRAGIRLDSNNAGTLGGLFGFNGTLYAVSDNVLINALTGNPVY